jgi:argonaute-like protein implicated in RNA metabolism and viral defense
MSQHTCNICNENFNSEEQLREHQRNAAHVVGKKGNEGGKANEGGKEGERKENERPVGQQPQGQQQPQPQPQPRKEDKIAS